MNKKVVFGKKFIYVLVMVVVFTITIGYAAFGSEMALSGIVAEVRQIKDVRVTGFSYSSSVSSGVANSYDYSVKSLLTNVKLPSSDSSVTYKVTVTNFGNVEMGIYELTGLPSNLTYEVSDYTLQSKICDDDGACSSGIVKTFDLTIKYTSSGYNSSSTTYDLNIGVDFRDFYTVTYKNITNNGYPTAIINGGNLSVTFTGDIPETVLVYVNNEKVSSSLYSYSNNTFTFNNVTGNITISPPETFVTMMKNGAVSDSSVSFSSTSGLTTLNNTAYIRSGTESDANPIYYYRGYVDANNVYFAGFCWKIVRTTETGGTKLIYNGTLKEVFETVAISESDYTNVSNDATYPYTFDSSALTWTSTNKTNSATGEISFTVATAGTYAIDYSVSSEKNYDKAYFYLDDTLLGTYSGTVSGSLSLGEITTSNVIKVQYTKDSSTSSGTDTVTFSVGLATGESSTSCGNTDTDSQLSSTSAFNSSYTSPADVGYMYGTRYAYSSKSLSSQSDTYLYGNTVIWDGTNYTLSGDTYSSSSWSSDRTTLATKYHYTCFDSDGSCTSVYYIHYFGNSSTAYYLTFTGGKTLETAKDAMFTNTTNSKIKTAIDTWYASNMTSYTDMLEDTVWCNDRTFYNGTLSGESVSSTSYSYFSAYGRNVSTKSPSLTCPDSNDAFTVSSANGNGALTYPVGLLTADELTLAGSGYSSYSTSSYLYTGQYWWSLSPSYFDNDVAYGFYLYSSGQLNYYNYVSVTYGVRPSVSLAPGTKIAGGDGTASNPYTVG